MTNQPLSPAAQAVIEAIWDAPHDGYGAAKAAAALRAVADHVVPMGATTADYRSGANNERIAVRSDLLAIAAELDPRPLTTSPPLTDDTCPEGIAR